MSNSRSTQWRRARSDLDLNHEQLDCAPDESCFYSVSYEGAHATAADGVNDVDSVELEAISDLECDVVGWR
jgi:hypothetical protein